MKRIKTARFSLCDSLSNRQLSNVCKTLTMTQCIALIDHMETRVNNGYENTFRDNIVYNGAKKRLAELSARDNGECVFLDR